MTEHLPDDLFRVGRIVKPHGLKGDLVVLSYTHPAETLFDSPIWLIGDDYHALQHHHARQMNKKWLVRLADYNDIDSATQWCGRDIYLRRSELHNQDSPGYYWQDLEGLRVELTTGQTIGHIDFLHAGTGFDLIVVVDTKRQQHIIPYTHQTVKRVDLSEGVMVVDWNITDYD